MHGSLLVVGGKTVTGMMMRRKGKNLKTNLLRIPKLHDRQRRTENGRIVPQRQGTCAVSSRAAVRVQRLLEDLPLIVLVVDLLDVVAAPAGYV